MAKQKNRWLILAALFVNAFCCGGMYAWSVFSGPLAEYRGWDYGKVTFAYSMMSLLLSAFGVVGGKLLDQFGPKKLMTGAGFLWGGGWFLSGCVQELWQLYLTFGIIAAVGSGMAYNPSITTASRWFPDKRGMATGLITGATGLAALIIAPVANLLLERYNVTVAFRLIGVCFFICMFCASLFTDSPEEQQEKRKSAGSEEKEKDWKAMMADRRFYLIWLAFLGSCVSGLMLIGHAATIGREIAGINGAQAAMLVGIMAVANFAGRLFMGSVSDKIGRYQTVMISLVLSAVDMIVLSQVKGFVPFAISLIMLCTCFGGVLAVFPNIVADNFGIRNMGTNYGIVFTAYGIAALVGPMMASIVKTASGSYNGAFIAAGGCAVTAFALVVLIYHMSKKYQNT